MVMANDKTTKSDKPHELAVYAKEAVKNRAQTKKQVTKLTRKRRQPTKFTDHKWRSILECVATYGDLIEACSRPNMPSVVTVYRWMRNDPKLRADMEQAWEMASYLGQSVNNNILRGGELSTGDFNRDKELVAANRWHMGKTNRRVFGDKTQVDMNQTINMSVPDWANPMQGTVIDAQVTDTDPDEAYEQQTITRLTHEAQQDIPVTNSDKDAAEQS